MPLPFAAWYHAGNRHFASASSALTVFNESPDFLELHCSGTSMIAAAGLCAHAKHYRTRFSGREDADASFVQAGPQSSNPTERSRPQRQERVLY